MKQIRKLLALLLAICLLCSLTACGNKENRLSRKYQEIINDFAEGEDMEETLMIGDEHRAWGAHHLNNGPNFFYQVYTSDENVVTISSRGKVTAVGEGVAYVIIAQKLPIFGVVDYDCSKYTVYADETQMKIDTGMLPDFEAVVQDFSPDNFNCHTLTKGETYIPSEAIWLFSGMGGVYSSNEAVATVAADGTITAVSTGVAYVVIAGSARIYEVLEITVTE